LNPRGLPKGCAWPPVKPGSGDVHHVGAELTLPSVGEIACQGFFDGAKSDVIPGDFSFGEQLGFHGFMARVKVRAEQLRGKTNALGLRAPRS